MCLPLLRPLPPTQSRVLSKSFFFFVVSLEPFPPSRVCSNSPNARVPSTRSKSLERFGSPLFQPVAISFVCVALAFSFASVCFLVTTDLRSLYYRCTLFFLFRICFSGPWCKAKPQPSFNRREALSRLWLAFLNIVAIYLLSLYSLAQSFSQVCLDSSER